MISVSVSVYAIFTVDRTLSLSSTMFLWEIALTAVLPVICVSIPIRLYENEVKVWSEDEIFLIRLPLVSEMYSSVRAGSFSRSIPVRYPSSSYRKDTLSPRLLPTCESRSFSLYRKLMVLSSLS